MKAHSRGQVLIGVLVMMLLIMIATPSLIKWIQSDTEWSVKQQKSSTAFNLANGAIERGTWKLKSSTSTWAQAANGTVITGYNFDTTYQDIEGGTYRIRFSSGPGTHQVTVTAEARDAQREERRAIMAVYENQAIPGPILTGGNIALSGALEPHWGPVMAQGNIALSGAAATNYFPRKFSKNVVTGPSGNARDTNGLTPPNTDNQEWWSNYPVPDLPQLDFIALRSSAQANGNLNYYNGFTSSHTYTGYTGSGHSCNVAGTSSAHGSPHNTHFADSNHHPRSKLNQIWYWDGNVNFTGGANLSGHSNGLYGTIIIRGNMTLETEDNYSYTATVPSNVWREYQRIDTASANQYPGDLGFHLSSGTFGIGSQTWSGGPASASYSDVGFRGFIYVGGNLTIATNALGDFAGAIWVAGNVTNANTDELSLVFYDPAVGASLPVLNVVLVQQSWREVAVSIAWP
jgi:hypothetical protein